MRIQKCSVGCVSDENSSVSEYEEDTRDRVTEFCNRWVSRFIFEPMVETKEKKDRDVS